MDEDQRREYEMLLRSIIDHANSMQDPEDDEEMLFARIEELAEKVEELQELLDDIYS